MAPNKNKKIQTLIVLGLVVFVTGFFVIPAVAETTSTTNSNTNTDSQDFTSLNQDLDAKRAEVESLKKKTEAYQKSIQAKQQEALTLQNQMAVIDLQQQQTENDITTIRTESDAVNLELQQIDQDITKKTDELTYNQEILAEYLRLINKYDQQSYLEILMSKSSFSEFFDRMQYTQSLEGKIEETTATIKSDKESLEQKKTTKETKKQELNDLSSKLTSSLDTLESQKSYKSNLLETTKDSQTKFEELLEQAKQQELAAEAEMNSLEAKARQQLEEKGIDLNVSSTLMWPVSPLRGISAYFHDPTYIFKRIFEHPAIDIPTPQGTALRAADNGYVIRAKNAGMGYSYIMIVHNNQLSTVYGHVSRIDVSEDSYVLRGQQIGLTGGMPGTPGAGGLTTGPHLHFEVRLNGIPVNPLNYLPSL